ncbi:uncharacterized protein [Aristolochia californica]|uniref:uncharacterized protein n=1 Tax=Aristolochia californica TaxID=171875 RepID=UPI0035D930C3
MDPVFVATTINVTAQISNIPMLNGMNFKTWKYTMEIVLGCMDLDLALRAETPTSTFENLNEVKIQKSEGFNRMCLMIMKCSILEAFQGSITESKSAKKFLRKLSNILPRTKSRRRVAFWLNSFR